METGQICSVIELASDYAILNRGVSELLMAMSRRVLDTHLKTGQEPLDICFTKLNELLEENNALREKINKMEDGQAPKSASKDVNNVAKKILKDYDKRTHSQSKTYQIYDDSGTLIGIVLRE